MVMTDKYKYLDLPDDAPQWLMDAHAAGHAGVLCNVWRYSSESKPIERFIINDDSSENYRFIDSDGEWWSQAEPIEQETEPEQSEMEQKVIYPDQRIAALIGNQPVTVSNAETGAEAMSLLEGIVIITGIKRSAIHCKNKQGKSFSWIWDGRVKNGDEYPDLYWPNGIVQPKPECDPLDALRDGIKAGQRNLDKLQRAYARLTGQKYHF